MPGQAGFNANTPVTGFGGFSANPLNPFDNSSSRIPPFYDFDINSLGWMTQVSQQTGGTLTGIVYWPKVQAVTAKATAWPIVYFRAENGNYTMNGGLPLGFPTTVVGPKANVKTFAEYVWPAIDTRLSNVPGMVAYQVGNATVYTWINPSSFQIFSSGLDLRYAMPKVPSLPPQNYVDCVYFPTGESYQALDPNTGGSGYDDITNFSGGTLESAMP